jgi:hypothetical protein
MEYQKTLLFSSIRCGLLPKNLFRTEWKYDTSFRYRLSGRELESDETAKPTIVVGSFRRLEVVSDAYKPTTQTSY